MINENTQAGPASSRKMQHRSINPQAFRPPPRTETFLAAKWWLDRGCSLLLVIPASFLLGMLTSLGQSELPEWISSIANSSGGWSAAVFALIWGSRSRPLLAVIGGIVSFALLNVGYAVMSGIRGFSWSLDLSNFFVLLGFIVGPVIGLTAALLRSRHVWLVAIATAALPTILVGEGIYGLIKISDTTSPVYWTLSIAAGVIFLAVVGALRLRAIFPILLSVLLSATGAAAFYLAYSAA